MAVASSSAPPMMAFNMVAPLAASRARARGGVAAAAGLMEGVGERGP
jgi:hypothetical protein